jgi:hypothetical protein
MNRSGGVFENSAHGGHFRAIYTKNKQIQRIVNPHSQSFNEKWTQITQKFLFEHL